METLSTQESLIEVYLSVNEAQTQADKYSCSSKILYAEDKSAILENAMKTYENFNQ